LFENINDYVFSELGITENTVNHPLMLTECLSNPDYCR